MGWPSYRSLAQSVSICFPVSPLSDRNAFWAAQLRDWQAHLIYRWPGFFEEFSPPPRDCQELRHSAGPSWPSRRCAVVHSSLRFRTEYDSASLRLFRVQNILKELTFLVYVTSIWVYRIQQLPECIDCFQKHDDVSLQSNRKNLNLFVEIATATTNYQ